MLYGNFMPSTICINYTYKFSCTDCSMLNQDKLSDVKNMNWCKFIADFIHDAFAKKLYQKGCRLYLMASASVCLFFIYALFL